MKRLNANQFTDSFIKLGITYLTKDIIPEKLEYKSRKNEFLAQYKNMQVRNGNKYDISLNGGRLLFQECLGCSAKSKEGATVAAAMETIFISNGAPKIVPTDKGAPRKLSIGGDRCDCPKKIDRQRQHPGQKPWPLGQSVSTSIFWPHLYIARHLCNFVVGSRTAESI